MQISLMILGIVFALLLSIAIIVFIYDRFIQRNNLVIANFPIIGRFRYFFHELRPFFRQYFGDDNSWAPRIIIEWILEVSRGKTGYFSFDKFDTTEHLHDGNHQMIHSSSPLNNEEMRPEYPLVGKKRKHPLQFKTFFYRSAMSLGSIGPEATEAMAAACCDAKAAFNTGEGGLSIHHLPRVRFNKKYKWMKYHKVSWIGRFLHYITPTQRLKNHIIDILGWLYCPKHLRDLYLYDNKNGVFYTINWDAPKEAFPNANELTEEFGNIIFQIGSGLYGLRKKNKTGKLEIDFERFQKASSFCRAIEIKLAQGAKQTGGILKAIKNTPTLATIRGVEPGIDLVSQNRFPYYKKGEEKIFFDFIEKISNTAGGKPVGIKIVISDESNIEPFAQTLAKNPEKGPDFITIDGGDGGSATAPIALGILFGKTVFDAIEIAQKTLKKYKIRDKIKLFASSKLYAPHMSARALALGADAIGNARSIMLAGGCIRAGVCSGEIATCPIGMATMNKNKRRAYAQSIQNKTNQIGNYIKAHNKGLIQVAAICGVASPSLLNKTHIMTPLIQIGHHPK